MLGEVKAGRGGRAGFTLKGLSGIKPAALTNIEISEIV